ncbi:MAG: lytic transglycosylase domain-containing protein [Beijerinckiaceae bacterium]
MTNLKGHRMIRQTQFFRPTPFRQVLLAAAVAACATATARADSERVDMMNIGPAAVAPEATAAAPAAEPAVRQNGRSRVRNEGPLTFNAEGASGVRALIARKAAEHGVPAALADAVARVESRYNPRASNAGNFGLMQIRHQTARGEGYTGSAQGLLHAETNAHFGIKHLARAYRMAGGDVCGTVMRYQSGLAATRMNGANRTYCGKVRAIMGAYRVAGL